MFKKSWSDSQPLPRCRRRGNCNPVKVWLSALTGNTYPPYLASPLSDPDYCLRSTIIETCLREGYRLNASLGNLGNYTVKFTKSL